MGGARNDDRRVPTRPLRENPSHGGFDWKGTLYRYYLDIDRYSRVILVLGADS